MNRSLQVDRKCQSRNLAQHAAREPCVPRTWRQGCLHEQAEQGAHRRLREPAERDSGVPPAPDAGESLGWQEGCSQGGVRENVVAASLRVEREAGLCQRSDCFISLAC